MNTPSAATTNTTTAIAPAKNHYVILDGLRGVASKGFGTTPAEQALPRATSTRDASAAGRVLPCPQEPETHAASAE